MNLSMSSSASNMANLQLELTDKCEKRRDGLQLAVIQLTGRSAHQQGM